MSKSNYSMWEIFKINKEIETVLEDSVDEETGEILDQGLNNKLDKLEFSKEIIFADLGRFVQATKNMATVLKTQIKELQKKKKIYENNMERIKNFLKFEVPENEKINFPDVKISWRKSEAIEINDELLNYKQLDKIGALDYKPTVSKTKIKEYLEANPKIKLQGVKKLKKIILL